MQGLQSLSSPLTTTQNPRLQLAPSLSFQSSTKRTAFNPNIWSKKLSVKCQQYFQQQRLAIGTAPSNSFSSQPPGGGSTTVPGGTMPPRFFVGHSIYKGKAALTVEPRAPEFTSLDSGAFKLSKEGFVLLQFAPAAGVRQYDWNRKQVFSLSVTEIGTLVSLEKKDSCEFFHDPFKGKSEEGKVRKVLKVEPLPDGSGRFFNLSVQNKLINVDESIYIPVTRAEYTVLVSAFNFILPYILGWHAFANSIKPEDTVRVNNANSRYGGDFEWSR
ncbi:single-stranded DNA-binding protein WHY1, chloroplastic-like [Alnus glutinosa]|uniref:single-stranded DNA-binding protein WHY1, chloroplastic-like n=1 Tax=Alnus glutinosa TaxID=3517 RepID=UPI002D76A356|nr:single-stranded DNA-binding protein WHY1, chloroplastic-like [Alnus glutinosa]